jgi:hypothetical protein
VKYKRGDEVILVKPELNSRNHCVKCKLFMDNDMIHMVGSTKQVRGRAYSGNNYGLFNGNGWSWCEHMLEPVQQYSSEVEL